MAQCAKCGMAVDDEEMREHHGKELCEDCYLDVMNPPKACDPWAVHTAKSFGAKGCQQLTESQQGILKALREHGPMKADQLLGELGISESDFRNAFATLRHMELARGFKDGNDIYYTLFSS